MYYKSIITVSMIFSALALAGCSSNTKQKELVFQEQQTQSYDTKLDQTLMLAADHVSQAMQNLSEIKRAQYPHDVSMPLQGIEKQDSTFKQAISVHWYGPISPVIKNIADSVGYDYQVYGKPPNRPVLVNINAQDKAIINVLRNIDLQANNQANIQIFPNKKVISLRYFDS